MPDTQARKAYGRGVFRITRDGRPVWLLDISYRDPKSNNPYARIRYRRDLRLANQLHSQAAALRAAQEEADLIHGNIAKHGSPEVPLEASLTFGQVADQYIAEKLILMKRSTGVLYRRIIRTRLVPLLGEVPIKLVDRHKLDKLNLRHKDLDPGEKNNIQIVARSVLRFAEYHDLIEMPRRLPRLRQLGARDRLLPIPTDDEVKLILGAAKPNIRRAFEIIAYAGLRPNEVRPLHWGDIQSNRILVRKGEVHGEVSTTKTNSHRLIPIDYRIELGAPGNHLDRICLNCRGGKLSDSTLSVIFKRITRKLNLNPDLTLYCLRHYCITQWARRSLPIHELQYMAGHKNIKTTMIYIHRVAADAQAIGVLLGAPPVASADVAAPQHVALGNELETGIAAE